MTHITRFGIVVALALGIILCSASPGRAQPGRFGPPPPPRHHHHHGPSDFDKTMRVLGAVGAVAAAANGYTPYGYYRQPRPVVVVTNPQPATIVVEKSPVVVEKIVERPVIVEKEVPMAPGRGAETGFYSHKLGAYFRIENMKIPGYTFKAARLTSDPFQGSPLEQLGLVEGDVITRLNDDPLDALDKLDRHEKNTAVRYIKTGTVKVRLGRIYIPTDTEVGRSNDEVYYAP